MQQRCKSATASREQECLALGGCSSLSGCRFSAWARWVEGKMVFPGWAVGRGGLESGLGRNGDPSVRGRGALLSPPPPSFPKRILPSRGLATVKGEPLAPNVTLKVKWKTKDERMLAFRSAAAAAAAVTAAGFKGEKKKTHTHTQKPHTHRHINTHPEASIMPTQ